MTEFSPNSPTGYKLPDPTNHNPFWEDETPAPPADFHGLPPGGEPGQVLTKSSYADYDADWQEPTGGGGGEGGTSDYNELTNKPSINGTQLRGDKTLDQLGIASADDMRQMDQELEGQIAAEQADRKKADDDLEAGIKANADAIQDETNAREQADADQALTLTAHTQELTQHAGDIENLQTDVEEINKRIDDIGEGKQGPAGADGEDGGYYQPTVSDEGVLSWQASKAGMPAVSPANIKGPKGDTGAQGPAGADGSPGTSASVSVGSTTTLPAGSKATVTNSGTSQNAVLNFGIPKGADGIGGGGSLELGTVAGDFYVGSAPTISGATLSFEIDPSQLPDTFKDSLPYVIGGFITVNLIGAYLDWTGPLVPIKSWRGGRGVRFLSQGIAARYGSTDYTTVSGDNSITDDATAFVNLTFQGSLGGGATISNVQITYSFVTVGAPAATAEQEEKTLDVLKAIQTRGENVAKLLKASEPVY